MICDDVKFVIGKVLSECNVDGKASRLLTDLYNEASIVLNSKDTDNNNTVKIIYASDNEGDNILIIPVMILSDDIDVESAVINSCIEFYNTEDGRRKVKSEGNWWNWGDFYHKVPNDICVHHGILKTELIDVIPVSYDQQLIPNID